MIQLINVVSNDERIAEHGSASGSTIARHVRAVLGALAAAILLIDAVRANADDLASPPYLLGTWGGDRTRLADLGVVLEFNYGSEVAHDFSGGTRQLTRYTDQWLFGATVDLDRVWGWKGGTFQGTYTDRNGRNLGADAHIGNSELVQEIYGRSQTWHLTQFWLDQKALNGRLDVKLGRLTVDEDFASFSCEFQNLTFCGSQPGNVVSHYWVNWPTSEWATRIKVKTSTETYLQAGLYQVNPRYLDDDYARRDGWRLDNPKGTTGALIPVELGWQPIFDGRPGSYKVGAWYNTSNGPDLYDDIDGNPRGETGLNPRIRKSQYGAYLSFQQKLTGLGEGNGASVFLNITQADRATAPLDRQIATGMIYRGPFARDRDAIGLGVGATHSNPRLAAFVREYNARTGQATIAGGGYEYVIELYYSWAPIPALYLRPNLQYIARPGGTSDNRDAFVVGLKSGITF